MHNKKYTSIPKDADPMAITLEEAIQLIKEKREQESQKYLRSFDADGKLQILNGRYGPYIVYNGKNYRMPKAMHTRVAEMTYDECMAIVNKNEK
jgi:DNA topoisomerase-1